MSGRKKLLESVINNPRDVRFDDACKIAEWLGFTWSGGKGAHRAFSRRGQPIGQTFQRLKDGKIKPYQARQLIEMIELYGDEVDPR